MLGLTALQTVFMQSELQESQAELKRLRAELVRLQTELATERKWRKQLLELTIDQAVELDRLTHE